MNYKEILKKYNQEHLLKYIDNANDEQKEKLINDIENTDFEQLKELFAISNRDNDKALESCIIEHISYTDKLKLSDEKLEKLNKLGEDVIKNGQYAVVTMAGGQGTRLGHDGPKGTFLLNVSPKPKYLFEIIVDSLKRINEKYGITLNWYVMTSTENNKRTVDFISEHDFFGYPKENVMFFEQGNLPLLNEEGKVLVNENYDIKIAADGNGCIYKSMKKDGVLDDMKKKGIKWVFVGSVDNAIVDLADTALIGLTIEEGNQIGSKSVVKVSPKERVGVFCKKNGVPAIIEYSELPEEMAEETDEDGELLFGESNILCHLYSLEALEILSEKKLPYHSAHKKASYLKEDGEMFIATEPNVYKYESFIFDGFNFFDNMSLLRVKREEDFAPIKNKEGNDSPETAIKLYNDKYNK